MKKTRPPKRRNPEARTLACPSLRLRRVETAKGWSKTERAKAKLRLRKLPSCDQGAAGQIRAAA